MNNGGISIEYLEKLGERLKRFKSNIPLEALDGKYVDSNIEIYRSLESNFIGLGKLYFCIEGKINAEELYSLIENEKKEVVQNK